MQIALSDVGAQIAPYRAELEARLSEVLESGVFIRGPNVQRFQEEAARYLGVRRTVGVANGTDALVLVLDALGIGPGDEVICPAFTFWATVEAVLRRGATPVFADIDPATLNLDPEDVASRLGPQTKAILAVHLFGRPAPIDAFPDSVSIIEDAAQAFGASLAGRRVGTLGQVATFSFYPTKNLFCLGDGGLVATDDQELADRIRTLAFHGSRDKLTFELAGYNSRLDELQAAVLRLFLPALDGWNAARREAASRYAKLGLGELVELPKDEPGHVYHLYVARSLERDRILSALRSCGVGCGAYYGTPLHLQPATRALGYRPGSLPETERASRENLALPLWPGISAQVQERVVGAVRSAVKTPVAG